LAFLLKVYGYTSMLEGVDLILVEVLEEFALCSIVGFDP
jgi:hypothetical protein